MCEHWDFGSVSLPCYCCFTNDTDSSFSLVTRSGCSWLRGEVGLVFLMLIWCKGLFVVFFAALWVVRELSFGRRVRNQISESPTRFRVAYIGEMEKVYKKKKKNVFAHPRLLLQPPPNLL